MNPVGIHFAGKRATNEELRRLRERAEQVERDARQLRQDIIALEGTDKVEHPDKVKDSQPAAPAGTVLFLSPEWAAALEKGLNDEGFGPLAGQEVGMILIVTTGPRASQQIWIDLKAEKTRVGIGESPRYFTPHFTLTTDYEVVKNLSENNNPQVFMQAFMAGRIKIQGDMTRLMTMQAIRKKGGTPYSQSLFSKELLGKTKVVYD